MMAECKRLREDGEAGPTCGCTDGACALDVKSLDDEAIRAIYDRGYVDGLDDGYGDGYKDGAASLASRIGGAAARLEEFVETGDTEVLLEGLDAYCVCGNILGSESCCPDPQEHDEDDACPVHEAAYRICGCL